MKFSTVIENVWFPKFNHGTFLPLHHKIIIWSLNRSSVIIFDNLFPLSLHGRCLSSLDRQDLLVPQSRTTIIAQHRAYASVKVEPDITRHCFWSFVNFIIWFRRQVTILFPIFKCLWQKTGSESNFVANWISLTLQTAKKLQLIGSHRKLRFKLPEMNLIDSCIMKEKKYGLLSSYSWFSALLRLPIWKGIFRNDTSQNETHAGSACSSF